MTLGKSTRSPAGWLFPRYPSGYRYANGSPNPFRKTWGVYPSLIHFSSPPHDSLLIRLAQNGPNSQFWRVCVYIYLYTGCMRMPRKSLILEFGGNIHHCQPAYTLHMPLARPISPPIARWWPDRTAYLLICRSAAVSFVLFTNVNVLWMKPSLGVLRLWRTQAKRRLCSHKEHFSTCSHQASHAVRSVACTLGQLDGLITPD